MKIDIKGMLRSEASLRLRDEVVLPLAKLALTSVIFAVGNKLFRKAAKVEGHRDAVSAIVQGQLVSIAVDSVTKRFLKDDEDRRSLGVAGEIVAKHLGVREWYEDGFEVPSWKRAVLSVSLRDMLDNDEDCSYSLACSKDGRGAPKTLPILVGYGKEEIHWIEGLVLVEYKGIPLALELDIDKVFGKITVHGADSVAATNFSDKLRDHATKNNFMKGLAMDGSGGLIYAEDCPTWEDVVFSETLVKKVTAHTIGFLQGYEEMAARGIKHRGCLWVGEPGTGKTSVAKILAGLSIGKVTYLSISAPTLDENSYSNNTIEDVYRWARNLAPCIILLDDLDRARHGVISQLLGEMDGAHPNDGIVTIATVNDPSALDLALRDRPNRFDVVVDFALPDESQRAEMIDLFSGSIKGFTMKPAEVKALAKSADGLAPAHIDEAIRRMVIEARGQGVDESYGLLVESLRAVIDQHKWMRDVEVKKKTGMVNPFS